MIIILVSCTYCGGLHERGEVCKKKPINNKRVTKVDRFRWSQPLKNKRENINKRDKYLCLVCLSNNQYNYTDLSVHHIDSLIENFNRRLDDLNLITLCRDCYEEGEKGNISKNILFKLVEESEVRGRGT